MRMCRLVHELGKDYLNIVGALLGIGASVVTIYQAFKKCPCDGEPLPFKAYCKNCRHNHWF